MFNQPLIYDGTNWKRRQHAAQESADGVTPFFNAALSTTVQTVKSAGGLLKGWFIHNPDSATAYVQIFNVAAGSVTLGTTTPTLSIGIPAGVSANFFFEPGFSMTNGISAAATTTATGNTAPGTALVVNLAYT